VANVFMGAFVNIFEEVLKHISIDLVIVEDKPNSQPVVELCCQQNIRCEVIRKYEDIVSKLTRFDKIELCVVAAFGVILKKDFIEKCHYVVNFHLGDVARYRGRHPLPTAILNKSTIMGATAHLIDSEEIDAGPILAKTLVPIDYDRSFKYNKKRVIEAMASLASLLMRDYVNTGRLLAYSWEHKSSAYYKPFESEIYDKIVNAETLRLVL
jgi:methionyl-tRNA formyltransferase